MFAARAYENPLRIATRGRRRSSIGFAALNCRLLSLGALAGLCLLGACVPRLARAQAPAPAAPLVAGEGLSYWGPIPPPADSLRARFLPRRAPLWERTLGAPYELAVLPLGLAGKGVKAGFVYADEHGWASKVAWLLGPQDGPFGLKLRVEAGELIGPGAGLVVKHDAFFGPENAFALRWRSNASGTHRVHAGGDFAGPGRARTVLAAGYSLRPNARFFGLGPDSREASESYYTQELAWGAAALRLPVTGGLSAEVSARYAEVAARGPGPDDEPALPERFDDLPAGYGARSRGTTLGLTLVHDTTTENGRPRRGGIRHFGVARHVARDGESGIDYTSYRGELEQFVPLWNAQQALALRLFADWIDAEQPSALPFQRLPANDEPFLLRGYRDFRWRGTGITGLSVEYRWPLWAYNAPNALGIDAYLFSDNGQDFAHAEDIGGGRLTQSVGGGLRLIGNGGFGGRVEIGRSEEGTVIRLRMDQVFQYARGSLMHGQDQVALR